MATRIGVDVGGTFTDVLIYDDEQGEVIVAKGMTTPEAPERGVLSAVDEAASTDLLPRAELFLHGTTVGLNALLERSGSRVALLCTAGFRDLLEIRRATRVAFYDLLWATPPPLIPRRLRIPIRERTDAAGAIISDLQEEDVLEALARCAHERVEAVAVAFLNAYANPANELKAEEILRHAGFGGSISLSHRVSGEYREYERTSTTVVDAYVRPRVSEYLGKLGESLAERRFAGRCLITRSGGGSLLFDEASQRPFETIMSGPVAGAVGAAALASELGIATALTADVGGTSFDTAFVIDGRPQLKYQGEVAGMPLQSPWVDVRSIGAGGGSIAFIEDGLLRVGPRSAGARPGPACYARGGTKPTVTDAAAILGMLGEGELAGELQLDLGRAHDALDTIAQPLGISIVDAARGVLEIASAAMAEAMRSVTIEQGHDPRAATLFAFGGAGPLFATLLARELEMTTIVIPEHAGNFSAWGLLRQDITRSAARTSITPLDPAGLERANVVIGGLFAELARRRGGQDDAEPRAAADLRYVGQEYTLTVPIAWPNDASDVTVGDMRRRFEEDYVKTFGIELRGAVEIVSLRATLEARLPPMRDRQRKQQPRPGAASAPTEIKAYSFTAGEPVNFALRSRSDVTLEGRVVGPCIVTEPTSTLYLDAGFVLEPGPAGALLIRDTAP
jgi:N-methylhydantoinase A